MKRWVDGNKTMPQDNATNVDADLFRFSCGNLADVCGGRWNRRGSLGLAALNIGGEFGDARFYNVAFIGQLRGRDPYFGRTPSDVA